MIGRLALALLCAQLLHGCAPSAPSSSNRLAVGGPLTAVDLMDTTRGRPVPVMLYRPSGPSPWRLAVLSHGYGAQPDDYDFLATHLAARGWLVASIDHELPGDPPIPTDGEPRVVRMPNWRIGAESIGFAASALRERGWASQAPLLLVGHSNGGDMDMVFAAEHPQAVRAVISLDNRRARWPRNPSISILSLRSSDQVADEGVIPSPEEMRGLDLAVVKVATRHDDMGDAATEMQRQEMLTAIDAFLLRIGS